MFTMRSALLACGAAAVLFGGACTRDAEPARPSGSAPFESELPPVVTREEPGERAEAIRPPTRERPLCDALSSTARVSLDAIADGIVFRIRPAVGLRPEALEATRELRRALLSPSEYESVGDRTGCGIAELGRETSIAEIHEPPAGDDATPFEVRVAGWPGRAEVLRGRARVFVGELEGEEERR